MNTIEQIKAELKGKQIIVISENDGIANIKWDCRSLDDVKALLASAQSFIADKQVEELRGIGSGPDYNTTEGRYRNAHKFQHEHPEVNLEEEADKWRHHHFAGQRDGWYSGEYLTRESQLDIARHFYELGLNTRKEE